MCIRDRDTTVPEPTVASPSPTPTPTPTAPPTSALPTATLEQPLVRVIFNLVNLRRGPGVGFATMGSVAGGELLEVVARNDDEADLWYLVVTADQRVGWIAEEVVQVTSVEALQDVPVAATIPPAPIILPTATVTPTPTVIAPFTVVPTIDPDDDNGGGEGGGTSEPPPPPTAEPTDIPGEPPTLTPPPLPTVES